MNSAKIAVTSIIVVLVAFVVAVPVLSALFQEGGSFEQLEEVVTGTEETIVTRTEGCLYTGTGYTPTSGFTGASVTLYGPTSSVTNSHPTEAGLPQTSTVNLRLQPLPAGGIRVSPGERLEVARTP